VFKTLSVAFGVAAAVMIAELALRVHAAVTARDPDQDLQSTWNADPVPYRGSCGTDDTESGLAQIVRPSPWPDVVYELKPDVDTCFFNARVQINAEGLRAPRSFARPKPAGTWRLVLLGDSQTFGHGVAYEHTFGAIVERELAKRTTHTVEVINTGVDGYNTAMEAEHFARYGVTYQPDCVAILFIGNDLGLPHLMLRPRDPLTPRGSFLFAALRRAFATEKSESPTDTPWFEVARPPYGKFVPEAEIDRVPERYRHMVGMPGYRRALEKIARIARANRATIVNFAEYHRFDPTEIVEYQRGLGIEHPSFTYPADTKYHLSKEDGHLDVEGNAELARRVLAGLDEIKTCLPP
jgi:hypothetical protein